MEPVLLTIADVMDALRVSRTTVEVLINTGKLDTVKLGPRSVRIPRESLDNYVAGLHSNGS